jgi:ATP-dependent helicase Lhr and Lhr-like helicase
MLGLSRLETLAPGLRRVGLSATVEDPPALARYLAPTDPCDGPAGRPRPRPRHRHAGNRSPPPWAGGGGRYAIPAILDQVRRHRTTLIFHNTRAQAEIFFHDLWLQNEDGLPIGIHHGSLAREQRERVEAGDGRGAAARHRLHRQRSTSASTGAMWTLSSRWARQRTSSAWCSDRPRQPPLQRALQGAAWCPPTGSRWWNAAPPWKPCATTLDGEPRGPGPRDVLCQHILITACAGPFHADDPLCRSDPRRPLRRPHPPEFDACLDFCATGGYALRAYDRWQRLQQKTACGTCAIRAPPP